ncbi:hypothetical protein [Erythrobacter sp. WG]|uniref:hypothetical protein n=1 Tax=Erythrobacter sp. WG TaxID=2985510 RepID=UPI00226DB6A4|nr:hypothetical protein [Erythrobacter sp. WG]MCX9148249.1 hypothetical protein [Erythrobacter sp. WG]
MDQPHQRYGQAGEGALSAALRHASLILLVLLVAAMAYLAGVALTGGAAPFFAAQYLRTQDLAVAAVFALFWIMSGRIDPARLGLDRAVPGPNAAGLRGAALLALIVAAIGAVGVWLVFSGYGMAVDEHWARSDGIVIGTGRGMALIPEAWRDYAAALQPRFARITPDGWWVSEYLPVNAALQYLGGNLASPLLAGWAVLVAADLARRLLPEHPGAPLVCALLMASSAQLLVTAMTPFAMTAHLAFNLTWLWLLLHRDWRAQVAAMPVAFLAIGLHQAVFFPLFAAPFLLETWLSGRRGAAMGQALAIGAAFLFWSAWDTILYALLGAEPVTVSGGGTGTGTGLLFSRFLALLRDFTPASAGLMAINLVRFVTWQNAAVLPLVLVAAAGAWRAGGAWRAMLTGIVLTSGAVMVMLADQGHGWGYRYLHGYIGSACLLATFGWYRLPAAVRDGAAARGVLGAGIVLSLLLLPLRAWQAASFVGPYARADAAIAAMDADVVLIDAPRHVFALELVRNDPLLRNRPKRMATASLTEAQLARICRDFTIARFADADAARFGLDAVENDLPLKRLPQGCGRAGQVGEASSNASIRAALASQS